MFQQGCDALNYISLNPEKVSKLAFCYRLLDSREGALNDSL